MRIKHFLTMALLSAVAMVNAQEMPPIPADEAVLTGKLDNGLTYYVRHNNYPEHRVNFYIAQRVGSVQEEESQRGLAHFLEHMAFNGTENFHGEGKGVIDYTRTLGVEFGGDLNAYTSTDETVYNINDVPSTRESALDSCLLILRDWSCGLLLEDEEIDKERGVIHEEWRLRRSPSQRMLERNLETLFPGSKYGQRMPIGLMSVVDGFKYNELRDYYHKWYHPENQAIIVVGDIDAAATVEKIKKLFSPIKKHANAASVVPEAVPDNEAAIIVTDKDKEQPYSIVQLMFKDDPMPREMKGTMAYLLQDYMMDMITSMLNQRLSEKAQEPDCPFIQAGSYNGDFIMTNNKEVFSIFALPKEGQTDASLQAIMVEALRASKYGFTATEYERTKAEYLSRLEDRYNNRDKIENEAYGREYVRNYIDGDPYMSMETTYQLMNMLAPNIPVDLINQAMPELIPQSEHNMVVLNYNQEKDGVVYPTVEGLKGAVDAARAQNIEAYVDNVKNEPLITSLPKPGKIKKESHNDLLGYDELLLSNGVRVLLKKTDFKADEIIMEAESKGGSSLYGEKDWANTELFDAVLMMSGLGEFDNTELKKAMAGKQASANLSLTTSYERLEGRSTIKDLETMFQLAYLNFTNIHKDEKSYANLMSQLETVLKNKNLRPESVFSDSVEVTLNNHSWRDKPFNVEDLAKVDYDRVLQIAKERTANAADFTFYIVGSFDNDSIRKYLCQYIATLPAKGKKENYVNVAERATGKVLNHFTRAMETPKAMARMYWYNTLAPFSQENAIMADVAGQVLDKIYLQKIREDASAAYSAGAVGSVQRVGDKTFTTIMGVVPMKPEKADVALQIMRDEVVNVSNNVDEGTLAEIKELLIKRHDTRVKENEYWVNVLNSYDTKGIDLYSNYKNIVNGLTAGKIASFVKGVILAPGNHVEVVMMPEDLNEEGK